MIKIPGKTWQGDASYLSNNLSIYLSIHPSIHPSIHLSMSLSLSLYLSTIYQTCLSVCLSIYQSIYQSIYLSIYLSMHQNIYLSTQAICHVCQTCQGDVNMPPESQKCHLKHGRETQASSYLSCMSNLPGQREHAA